MIDDDILTFLEAVAAGKVRHDLFLCPTVAARRMWMQRLFDDANAVGLSCTIASAHAKVIVGKSEARFWAVYPYVDKAAQGYEFTAVHGLKYVDGFDKAEAIRGNLEARVR